MNNQTGTERRPNALSLEEIAEIKAAILKRKEEEKAIIEKLRNDRWEASLIKEGFPLERGDSKVDAAECN
ncbi:MAG: hypothetical protein J6M92_16735 [Oribacterium sp.]|nr:hypothetical protein [Oribacterium sp.]